MDIKVIGLDDPAFYELVKKLTDEIKAQYGAKQRRKWVDGEEAMAMLGITSKTTLQKLRDTGAIRYSQSEEMKKVIMYDANSIDAYLEKHAKDTF